ncbi:MAG: glycosyltransferase [Pseudomonadota bacterium]
MKKETSFIRGHIDAYQVGLLSGWVYDESRPDAPISVSVYDGQSLVGGGVADIYREDLMQNGMGNGRHAFSIVLREPLDDGLHRLSLRESGTDIPIHVAPFEIRINQEWSAEISGVDAHAVMGQFRCTNPGKPSVSFAVFLDQIKIGEDTVGLNEKRDGYPFRYVLPAEAFDGMPHVISVVLADAQHQDVRAAYACVLGPIHAPWQSLLTDAKIANSLYAGLPVQATRRLAIFHDRMRAIMARGGNAEEIQNLMTVLQVLNEGYENRKKFPRLDLPRADNPDVSIIIPVHNKFELTYHCLASLIFSDNKCSYEVIVVDDCSKDKTTEIKDVVGNVEVIVNEENLGFLRNCNKAAQQARGRYILLLNNDTEVGNGWLDEMLAVFERFDKVGAVGAKLLYPNGKLQEAGGVVWDNGQPWNLGREGNPFDPQWNYVRQVDYLSGAALAVPRAVWDEVGGLSDEFAPAYYEDTDLAFKVRAAGYRTFYCPHAEVIHFEGMSHGRDTSTGFKKYQAINAPKFREKWADAYQNNGRVGAELWRNKERGVRFRALVIDYAIPQPDKDAGSYAAIQEMRLLQSHGFKLTFAAENLAHAGRYTADLQKMGVECIHAPFHVSIQDLLQKRGREFDLVYITRFDVAERHIDHIRKFTRAKVLFNNADLHFLRELRMHLSQGHTDLSGPLATRERELVLMRKVDAVLSYNESEHAVILSHNLRDDNIFKCPWVVPAHGHKTPFAEREGIAFLGGYRHLPNVEAVEFFVEKVMPALRAKGRDIKFHIFGSHPPKEFERFDSDDIVVEGYVESLDDVFEKCRVFIAPLLSGAGIKGKVLEAMSWGVPSVLSPVAAEATGLTNKISAMIAEEPEEWVDAILELYEDEKKWQFMSGNALTIARNNYSFEHGHKLMGKALGYLGFYAGKADAYAVAK